MNQGVVVHLAAKRRGELNNTSNLFSGKGGAYLQRVEFRRRSPLFPVGYREIQGSRSDFFQNHGFILNFFFLVLLIFF